MAKGFQPPPGISPSTFGTEIASIIRGKPKKGVNMSRRYFVNRLQEERGVALVLSLLIVLGISVLSAGLLVTTLTESRVSSFQSWDTQALFIAEAGLEEALYRVNLQYPTEVTVNGETFNAAVKDTGSLESDWVTRIFLCSYPAPGGGGSSEHTPTIQSMDSWLTYSHPTDEDLALSVRHKLNGDGTIAMLDGAPINLVTIYGRKGLAKREVLAELYPERWFPNNALLCEKDMDIGGDPTIQGTVPHVHTNSNLDIGGSPYIGGNATASGSINISGNPTIMGDTASGVSRAWIPRVKASDFFYMHEYLMMNGGDAQDSAGDPVNPKDLGWNWTGNKWKVTGDAVDGVYYLQGSNVEVSGNPGAPDDPWEATIISEGYIRFTGNPTMTSHYEGILLVAEGDANGDGGIDGQPVVAVSGTPSGEVLNYCGAILSHGDLQISGNTRADGCLVAEGGIPIGGTPTITYNGTRYAWPFVRYDLHAWREK